MIHDAFELRRVEKIRVITDEVKINNNPIILRVCFSSKNTAINCSHCEKCYRTILGLIINNANPNDYGFEVSPGLYNEIGVFVAKGFYSDGEAYFWKELAESILAKEEFYYFQSADGEKSEIKKLGTLIFEQHRAGVRRRSGVTLMRQKVQLMFPNLTRNLIRVRNAISKLLSRI